jgi:hypothetical protein
LLTKPTDTVSATPADPSQGNTFFNGGTPFAQGPGSTYGGDINENLFGNEWSSGNNEMWYLPPGAAFFQNVGDQTITQTAEGVNVGGMDLLDYMALDPFPNIDGSGF